MNPFLDCYFQPVSAPSVIGDNWGPVIRLLAADDRRRLSSLDLTIESWAMHVTKPPITSLQTYVFHELHGSSARSMFGVLGEIHPGFHVFKAQIADPTGVTMAHVARYMVGLSMIGGDIRVLMLVGGENPNVKETMDELERVCRSLNDLDIASVATS